jgi:hypothetical protein
MRRWKRTPVALRQHSGSNRSLSEEPNPRAPNCRIVQPRKTQRPSPQADDPYTWLRFGGAFLSETNPRAPNCLAAEERNPSANKYLCPSAPLRRGLSFLEAEPNPAPPDCFAGRNVKKAMMDPQAPPTGERGFFSPSRLRRITGALLTNSTDSGVEDARKRPRSACRSIWSLWSRCRCLCNCLDPLRLERSLV